MMMTADIFLLIDADGNYVAHHDMDEIAQAFEDTHGTPVQPTRLYELNLQVPAPKATTIQAVVPDRDAPVTVTVT